VARQMESLRDGAFLDRRENLLVFGKPGSGKSHCLAALGVSERPKPATRRRLKTSHF